MPVQPALLCPHRTTRSHDHNARSRHWICSECGLNYIKSGARKCLLVRLYWPAHQPFVRSLLTGARVPRAQCRAQFSQTAGGVVA